MRAMFSRRSVRLAGLVVVLVLVVVGAAAASAARRSVQPAGFGPHPAGPLKVAAHPALSSAQVARIRRRATQRVIVVLGNQHRNLPANRRHVGSRVRAEAADQETLTA